MRARIVASLVAGVLAVAGAAHAEQLNRVVVGDVEGTDGRWQAGQVVVAAPAKEVQRWFADVPNWPLRFPDDEKVRDFGRDDKGRRVAEFHSRSLGRTLTVHLREQPGLITYEGTGRGITTQGRVTFEALGPDRTRITIATTGELHGAVGVLVSPEMKRKRALKKLTVDLNAAVSQADAYAAARRPRG
jgi:Polyketide cyclase / dehydrase and lipid transport